MRVGIPRETTQGERRVALVPETVGKLAAAGFELVVENGAGDASSFPDDTYSEAGATLGDPWEADAVVKVRKPSPNERQRLRSGQLLIARSPRGRRVNSDLRATWPIPRSAENPRSRSACSRRRTHAR